MTSAPNLAYRNACDDCHRRKVACKVTTGSAICKQCVAAGKRCTFSPREPTGRPRKHTDSVGQRSESDTAVGALSDVTKYPDNMDDAMAFQPWYASSLPLSYMKMDGGMETWAPNL